MQHTRTAALALAAALLLLLAAACDADPGTTVPELRDPNLETTDHRALQAARALWAARGATNYDMRLAWICFCGPDFAAERTLEVRNNAVTSGAIPGEIGVRADHQTVERLFTLIEDALDRRAAALNVTYHPTLGYPLGADIDYNLRIADEELGFTVHNLTLH